MALNFPTSPVNGQIYGIYVYDSSAPGWRKNKELSAGLPAGTIVQWPGLTAPTNWLIADGSAISRTGYASLYAAIGTTYGAGNGSTTFNLPDLRGRVPVGKSADTEFDTLGKTGGAKTHTLTSSEMPSHTHVQDAHNHTQNSHMHNVITNSFAGSRQIVMSSPGYGDGAYYSVNDSGTDANTSAWVIYADWNTATNNATTATNQNTGGGGAHNNLQPYITLNYIIKVSAGVTAGDSELATRVGALETGTRTVAVGGTGATTLTSGAYLKGAGTSAITAQVGIPAADVTSGRLDSARMPAGSILQVQMVRYQGRPGWTFNTSGDSIISYLNVPITPKSSSSMLICQFQISGELGYNAVYRAYRDGSLITNSGYEGYNTEDGNYWSGIASSNYDGDLASTPGTQFLTYHVPAGNTNATTMQIAVRASNGTQTIYLNRSFNSNGADALEIGICYAYVWEVAQ